MKISIIGAGCGASSLTERAQKAMSEAELIIGSERILAGIGSRAEKKVGVYTAEILNILNTADRKNVCVLFSGDSGFYSGARLLAAELENVETEIIPGISSMQYFAAMLGEPWQDWRLVSAHGTTCDIPHELLCGRPVFFLTDKIYSPDKICSEIVQCGLPGLRVAVGENLGTENEKLTIGTAQELSQLRFSNLCVVKTDAAPTDRRFSFLIPDEEYLRQEKIPMTKQEIRAVILSKLRLSENDICWDIGTGTGSTAIELSRHCRGVWSVEHDPAAHALAGQNREKLCAWNLRLLFGRAPEVFSEMPKPDAVFIGGSDRTLPELIASVNGINPDAGICVSAICLETLEEAVSAFSSLGYTYEISQISVNRSRNTQKHHLLLPQTSVFIISGSRQI